MLETCLNCNRPMAEHRRAHAGFVYRFYCPDNSGNQWWDVNGEMRRANDRARMALLSFTGFDDCPSPPDKPVLDPRQPRAFYFGPWDAPGHYLHDRNGNSAYHMEVKIPWKAIDGVLQPHRESCKKDTGYCGCGRGPEGQALLHHKDGWTALSFWDRSVDTRGNCNSTYFAEGEYSFTEMVAIAKAQFGHRWVKMPFEVVMANPVDWR